MIKAYHGTTLSSKEQIVAQGFNLGTAFHFGKMNGDAIYASTNKNWAEKFGSEIIHLNIDTSDFLYLNKMEYNQLYDQFMTKIIFPYSSMKSYLYNLLYKQIHDLDAENNRNSIRVFIRNTEYQIGIQLKEYVIQNGFKGMIIQSHKEDSSEITIYDTDEITILH